MTPGRRFMMDLLVGSLMADGGLESALYAAIRAEMREMESLKEKDIAELPVSDEREGAEEDGAKYRKADIREDISTSIPLLQLVQQLLRYAHTEVSLDSEDLPYLRYFYTLFSYCQRFRCTIFICGLRFGIPVRSSLTMHFI